MSSILDRIMRAGEGKTLRHLTKIAAEVNSFEAAISPLSDEALKAKTEEFKTRLTQGEDLDDLLPEAFAVVREVRRDKELTQMFPNAMALFINKNGSPKHPLYCKSETKIIKWELR